MLFVGLAGDDTRHSIIMKRLVDLGAVRGHIGSQPTWDVKKQAIVVLEGTAWSDGYRWPGLHLVIAAHTVGGSNDGADVSLDVNGSRTATVHEIDALWTNRIVPFESNLRKGHRAPRRQQAILAEPSPNWSRRANCLIERLRHSVGEQVIQVDHIGSTSVPGMPAKDLIDIQIVVADLDCAARVWRN